MPQKEVALYKERSNLWAVLLGIALVAIGVLFVWLSARLPQEQEVRRTISRTLGTSLFISAVISFIWKTFGQRAFLDETLVKVGLSRELLKSGIVQVTSTFHDPEIDWDSHFESRELDIFFAYGRTWRNTHVHRLEQFVQRPGAQVRVVLPDPEDNGTVNELARRFQYRPEQLVELIRESATYFEGLRGRAVGHNATVELRFLPAAPVYTYYRFGETGILALYSHARERVPVPAMILRNGILFRFFRQEFGAMVRPNGLTRHANG